MMSAALALVLAFGSADDFDTPASLGGGQGISFTGSPTAKWSCAVCHDAQGAGAISVSAVGRDLAATGYVPGETYELELTLTGASPTSARAAFALEISKRDRSMAGTLSKAMPLMGNGAADYACATLGNIDPVVVIDRSSSRVAHSYACAINKWRVSWTAPATDEGAVNLYASAVDSNADSRNSGDVTHSLVLGIPSPSTVGMRGTQSCSTSSSGVLLLLLLLLLGRRSLPLPRRGEGRGEGPSKSALAISALLLISSPTLAAPKKKNAKTKKTVPPTPKPVEPKQEEPVAPPPAEPTPPPVVEEVAAPAPVSTPAPAPAPTVAEIPDTSSLPGGIEFDAKLGYGYRSVSYASLSYATPFRASFGYPSLSLGVTVYPLRLLRSSVLTGLHVQGRYAVGWVLQTLPLGAALALPSGGRVALGYTLKAGPLELSPRALYRVDIGGVERNALFDDGYFQSFGGELSIGLVLGNFLVHVAPRGGAIVDVGTQMVRGYGASKGGYTFGGAAELGFKLSASLQLSASYQLNVQRTDFAGQGERAFEAMNVRDISHVGYLSLGFEY
ncbi:MAG: hypothetical protein QM817_26665 [Archangium sp.]